ncbi:hypothetical protein BHM03_00012887 [Ensete ventricosum]|uniref:Uncharacterized protein n=1 Tax=Ensete ventricosum TaxID=4639 RepID=A0A445MDR4_ENSVE|nr:hypothetical protein BHM03_00012887 [Ensete ventricosum]
MIGAAEELHYSKAHIRLREPDKSEDKAEGVEAGDRKGRGSANESRGTQLSKKNQVSVRMEVDLEESHSAAKTGLPIAKKGAQMRDNG